MFFFQRKPQPYGGSFTLLFKDLVIDSDKKQKELYKIILQAEKFQRKFNYDIRLEMLNVRFDGVIVNPDKQKSNLLRSFENDLLKSYIRQKQFDQKTFVWPTSQFPPKP